MVRQVSPEYDFETFCNHVCDQDPFEVIDAACAEIGYVRRLHREATKNLDSRQKWRAR